MPAMTLRTGAAAAIAAMLIPSVISAAESENPRTDWFREAGYGVFVHYLAGLQNNREQLNSLGRETSWDECVREFDTELFARQMEEAGARYVIFTVMQISRFMIAPNATFDRISGYKPGEACATRDLISDLYDSLARRDIRLMLYWTGDGPRGDAKAGPAFSWKEPVTKEFVTKWASVAREYGERYGEKVCGWWVDGSYPFIGYDDEKLGIMANALRAGNPNRIVALNPGVEAKVSAYSKHEDYTCGEQNVFHDMPVARFIKGEQWHILSYLGTWWGAPGCKYAKREIGEYVFDVNRRGGVVSIDVMLYRDGSLDRSQLELLKAVKSERENGRNRDPIPPGNVAFRKPAKLLSLDCTHELVVNSGVHFARNGVDGRMDTVAQGAEEWPWTYEVDLLDTVKARRVKATFSSGYPTRLEIRLSADGKEWKTVAAADNHDGKPFEAQFDAMPTRYVRVLSIKPDGPGQPGIQMAVSELEVYE